MPLDVVGLDLDSLTVVSERRMLSKFRSLLDSDSHTALVTRLFKPAAAVTLHLVSDGLVVMVILTIFYISKLFVYFSCTFLMLLRGPGLH